YCGEMSFLEDESSDGGAGARTQLESYVFSCELSSEVPFYTFQGDEEEDLEHFLELRTICLGEGAKEENNVVEVTAMNHQGKKISVPVANLHISCLPMVKIVKIILIIITIIATTVVDDDMIIIIIIMNNCYYCYKNCNHS
uniref:Nucleophosmin/nucleoplasmin, 3 n=1 Tax=Astyanax mexicanus TaxID=7994 RepID=A0A8B9J5T7_ASTMX